MIELPDCPISNGLIADQDHRVDAWNVHAIVTRMERFRHTSRACDPRNLVPATTFPEAGSQVADCTMVPCFGAPHPRWGPRTPRRLRCGLLCLQWPLKCRLTAKRGHDTPAGSRRRAWYLASAGPCLKGPRPLAPSPPVETLPGRVGDRRRSRPSGEFFPTPPERQ